MFYKLDVWKNKIALCSTITLGWRHMSVKVCSYAGNSIICGSLVRNQSSAYMAPCEQNPKEVTD